MLLSRRDAGGEGTLEQAEDAGADERDQAGDERREDQKLGKREIAGRA